jgi:hypothetical protein
MKELRQGSLTEGEGRLSTINLLVQTSLNPLLFISKKLLTFFAKSYLTEEVNRTEPSRSVRIPWSRQKG